ncbi:META domain-containing protein [Asticcacaulis sp.]|uniref:META domain-containing protein n=1 Tax=Asticcacaulis sp. TaxID=1872648 RepID=UPI0031D0D9D8
MRWTILRLTAAMLIFPIAVQAQSHLSLPEGPLIDTEWHLVSFMPNDEALPEYAPPRGVPYKMFLQKEGRARFQFDCNRASGVWSSFDTDDNRGTVTFGPLVKSNKDCDTKPFDQEIADDTRNMTGYRLWGGLLYIQSERGTYLWHWLE